MKILFCGETFPLAHKILQNLLPDYEITNCPASRVLELSKSADILIPLMHRLNASIIRATSARLIHQWGVGLEGVDIPVATECNIPVCNVPGDITRNADSTAEHALLLMMCLARKVHKFKNTFHSGHWGEPVGEALFGSKSLIVGLGNVGKALARKLYAMGVEINVIRRTVDEGLEKELNVQQAGKLIDLNHMSEDVDYVISTISLSDETRGIFDEVFFHSMKETAYFVNVSRGPVVNEEDLIRALRSHEIAGAGLDVFSKEPLDPASPLLTLDNVLASPHVAGATRQNYEDVARVVAANIAAFAKGSHPNHCVNMTWKD